MKPATRPPFSHASFPLRLSVAARSGSTALPAAVPVPPPVSETSHLCHLPHQRSLAPPHSPPSSFPSFPRSPFSCCYLTLMPLASPVLPLSSSLSSLLLMLLPPLAFQLLFIRDQLHCCCAWAFYLDSDAYFRMDNHRLPIEAWLAALPFTGAFNWIRDRYGMDLTNQTWMPQFPIALLDPPPAGVAACSQSPAAPCAEEPSEELIGLFARNSGEENGAPAALFNASLESINAGVMLLRRSPLTFQFLDTWYNEEPSNRHLQEATWEQNRLNRIAPLFAKHLVVVPYLELTGPEGRQVRHVWSMVGRHRDEALRAALLGALLANEVATKEDDWTPRGVVEKWAHDEMDARE
ncbi:unnamed protein product [Closterium sp. Naga37s-1]|nr:unnamed protein product [Closterium sp. Naga37s-1]